MSEHRKDEPTMLTISDRLPGEAELSELYRENADEQPSLVIDQLILNEADKAVQPPSHLRLIFRRWTVPLTLAAGLLVSIGVVTTLEDNVVIEQSKGDESQANTERRSLALVAKPLGLENRTRAVFSGFSSNPAKTSQLSGLVGAGAVQERQAVLEAPKTAPAPLPKEFASETAQADSSFAAKMERSQEELHTKFREEKEMHSSNIQRKDKSTLKLLRDLPGKFGFTPGELSVEGLGKPRTQLWLSQIASLYFRDHKKEAEESFQAFQKSFPDFDNFPENFPQELLDKVSAEAGSDEREYG